jgi:hypothetical protein
MEESNLGDSGPQDDIAHWAEVLDRWVKIVDVRLGGQDGASPASPDNVDADPGAEP